LAHSQQNAPYPLRSKERAANARKNVLFTKLLCLRWLQIFECKWAPLAIVHGTSQRDKTTDRCSQTDEVLVALTSAIHSDFAINHVGPIW